MKSIYLPTSRNFHDEGTPVKIYFEGKLTRGVLADSNDSTHTICVRTTDGKLHWVHESLVTLDRPEPTPRGRGSRRLL